MSMIIGSGLNAALLFFSGGSTDFRLDLGGNKPAQSLYSAIKVRNKKSLFSITGGHQFFKKI